MMRILSSSILIGLIIFFAMIKAETNSYKGPVATDAKMITSISGLNGAKDDQRFEIDGYIVNQIDSEYFTISDSKDTMKVEIDDDAWPLNSQEIDEKVKVRLKGEVDKDFFSANEIEVDFIEVVSNS